MIKYIEIYQLPKQKYVEALKNTFNKNYYIDMNNYERVYKCVLYIENTTFISNKELNISIADTMFEKFNVGEGINSNYSGRAFSTTDIIRIDEDYLLCESFGWRELKFKKCSYHGRKVRRAKMRDFEKYVNRHLEDGILYIDLSSAITRNNRIYLNLGIKIKRNNTFGFIGTTWKTVELDVEKDFTLNEFKNVCDKYNLNRSIFIGDNERYIFE